QPRLDEQPGAARAAVAGPLVAEALGEGPHGAGQAIDADQHRQATGAAPQHPHHAGHQLPLAAAADDAPQPQPAGPAQRPRQPQPAADQLDPQGIGLDVRDVDAALLDVQLMEALGVPAGALLPVGDRALVEAVGGDDGLAGAAVAEQGQDEGDQIERLVQAV